jgi:hypothetical protein
VGAAFFRWHLWEDDEILKRYAAFFLATSITTPMISPSFRMVTLDKPLEANAT